MSHFIWTSKLEGPNCISDVFGSWVCLHSFSLLLFHGHDSDSLNVVVERSSFKAKVRCVSVTMSTNGHYGRSARPRT